MPSAALLYTLFALSGEPVARAEVAGELCIFRGDRTLPACRETAGRRFAVDGADAPRYAVWWNREGTEAAVGAIPKEAGTIDLSSDGWQPMAIELRGSDGGPLPDVTLTVRAPKTADAVLTIPAHRVVPLRRLWLPAREVEISFIAEHHQGITRGVQAGTKSLGVIALQALPLLTGTIVAAENDQPLPYVAVALPSGATAATSDASGRFRVWVSGDWPELLRITAPGRATSDLPVPKIVGSTDLGRIRLGAGGTLRVQTNDEPRRELRLLRRNGKKLHEVTVRPEVSGTVDLERLERGSYMIVLRGTAPLQQLAIPAEVRDGETTEVDARVEPAELSLEVRQRNEGVRASIAMQPASSEWQTSITTGDDGRYEGEIWQRGEFVSFVTAGDTTTARHDRLEGVRRIEWTIELPHLQIAGTVLDPAGKAVAGAEVTLDTASAGSGTQSAEVTDAAGRFTFRGVEAGRQTLTAIADGYLPSTISFPLHDGDADYATTIRLRRGVRRTLLVTRQGQPAAHATVVDEEGAAGEQQADAAGRLAVTVAAGERKTFYVLPVDGSFAIADVSGDGAETTQRVDVAPGAATIRITAVSSEDEPVAGMFFAVRYNGRMLSPWVRAVMRNRRGTALATGADGVATWSAMPLGVYEIWPYFRADELPRIMAGLVPPRARIAAQTGVNEVRFTFERQLP